MNEGLRGAGPRQNVLRFSCRGGVRQGILRAHLFISTSSTPSNKDQEDLGMQRNHLMGRAITAIASMLLAFTASAADLKAVYDFNNPNDGSQSFGSLVEHHGVLYGTTSMGGLFGYGTVYSFNPATGVEAVLYSFSGGNDGAYPVAGLTYHDGYFYGTTSGGGVASAGAVFKIDPVTGTETILYSFADGTDGRGPYGGLIYHDGGFYGSTEYGGAAHNGVIFRIDATTGAESVIYRFTGQPDAAQPMGNLTYYKGTLYGIAEYGGSAGQGCVFAIDLSTGIEFVLYSFAGGTDGANPEGRLTEHGGKLYGTTNIGGATNSGTVFELDPVTGAETVLYSFAGQPDAAYPYAGVTYRDGKLVGDTLAGGVSNWGAVFLLDLATGQERVLGSFNGPLANVSLGVQPGAELLYFRGAFYGTTTFGFDGAAGGTIYRVSN